MIVRDVGWWGEGMLGKDEGAMGEWSRENVKKWWEVEGEMVWDMWNCVKGGGMVI